MRDKIKHDPLKIIRAVTTSNLSPPAKVIYIGLMMKADWTKQTLKYKWSVKRCMSFNLSLYQSKKGVKELKAIGLLETIKVSEDYQSFTWYRLRSIIDHTKVDNQPSPKNIDLPMVDNQPPEVDNQPPEVDNQPPEVDNRPIYSYSSLISFSSSLISSKAEGESERGFLLKHLKQNYELSDSELLQDDLHYHLQSSNSILIRLAPEVYHDQDLFIDTLLGSKLDLDFLLEMVLIGLYQANDQDQIKRKRIEL